MNKKDLKQNLMAALEWQLEMGVEDSFGDQKPETRSLKSETGRAKTEKNTPHPTHSVHSPLPQGERELSSSFAQNDIASKASLHEPAASDYQPGIMELKNSKTQENKNQVQSTEYKVQANNVEFLNFSNSEWVLKARELADKANNLEELRKAVDSFDGLSIKKTATNTVFGEGNPESKIMFIGEAPGENEDLEGRPFCGLSGQLLDKMLKFIGLERAKNFYITNTLFWRPPGNRKPTPEEIAICKPFVEKHIALINPKVIVCVGGTATYGLLDSKDSISQLRKVLSKYNNKYLQNEIPCFAIYHPSFLLRSPSQKKNAWADMIKIKKFVNATCFFRYSV